MDKWHNSIFGKITDLGDGQIHMCGEFPNGAKYIATRQWFDIAHQWSLWVPREDDRYSDQYEE